MKKERTANIDLLKIFVSLGVIILHYNASGIGKALSYVTLHTGKAYALYAVEALFACAVNVFVLISGYLMCNYKEVDLRKPLRLLIQVVAYKQAAYFLQIGFGVRSFVLKTFLSQLLPISYFAILYVGMYVLSPYINKLLSGLDEKQFDKLVLTVFLLFSVWAYGVDVLAKVTGWSLNSMSTVGKSGSQAGYTIVNFLMMYLIGAWLKRRNKTYAPAACLAVSIGCWLTVFASSYLFEVWGYSHGLALEYCNPVLVLQAAALFLLFRNISIRSNSVIHSFAKASFSVYLLNTTLITMFVDTKLYVRGNGFLMLAHMVLSSLAIFAVCWLAQILWDLVTTPIYKFLDARQKRNMTLSVQ